MSRRCLRPHPQMRPMRVHAGLIEKVNAEELEVAIMNRDKVLVVDFFATVRDVLPRFALMQAPLTSHPFLPLIHLIHTVVVSDT
jgi:hypothetical protein